jgi:hypothetical protein
MIGLLPPPDPPPPNLQNASPAHRATGNLFYFDDFFLFLSLSQGTSIDVSANLDNDLFGMVKYIYTYNM